MTANEVIQLLNLEPLPDEGGFFRQVYKSDRMIPASVWPQLYSSPRAVGTSIYALLTPVDFSALHLLKTDETWHFYAGDSLEMLNLFPDGRTTIITIGQRFAIGEQPQYTVPAGVWQGTRLKAGGSWALFGCTMAPGFEWEDFTLGDRTTLQAKYPAVSGWITALTRING